MANCGISEYDELPAVVWCIDVDYVRWRLYRCDHPSFIHKIPVIGWMLTPHSDSKTRAELISILEQARQMQ